MEFSIFLSIPPLPSPLHSLSTACFVVFNFESFPNKILHLNLVVKTLHHNLFEKILHHNLFFKVLHHNLFVMILHNDLVVKIIHYDVVAKTECLVYVCGCVEWCVMGGSIILDHAIKGPAATMSVEDIRPSI